VNFVTEKILRLDFIFDFYEGTRHERETTAVMESHGFKAQRRRQTATIEPPPRVSSPGLLSLSSHRVSCSLYDRDCGVILSRAVRKLETIESIDDAHDSTLCMVCCFIDSCIDRDNMDDIDQARRDFIFSTVSTTCSLGVD
jgi:hypothetical protein